MVKVLGGSGLVGTVMLGVSSSRVVSTSGGFGVVGFSIVDVDITMDEGSGKVEIFEVVIDNIEVVVATEVAMVMDGEVDGGRGGIGEEVVEMTKGVKGLGEASAVVTFSVLYMGRSEEHTSELQSR